MFNTQDLQNETVYAKKRVQSFFIDFLVLFLVLTVGAQVW